MSPDLDRRILVAGATANVGRLVVDELLARGARNVRALTNDPARAALPDGVDVAKGYIGKVDTLPPALDGVDALYLPPLPDTAPQVMALAKEAGVRHVVDLSGIGAGDQAEEDEHAAYFRAVEVAVEESGLAWTHLGPGEFMTNTLDWADQVRSGVVRQWCGAAATALIALEDIASVAATALLEDGHAGQTYALTGPEAISRIECTRVIGEVLGEDVRFEEQSYDEAFADYAAAAGEDFAHWYLDSMTEMAKTPQPVLRTVEEVTGRPGTTYREWVTNYADAFR